MHNLSLMFASRVEFQMEKLICRWSFRSLFGDFTLLFGRERLRNVQRCKTHLLSRFSAYLIFLFLPLPRCCRYITLLKVPNMSHCAVKESYLFVFNSYLIPLTPMSDQDRISPDDIITISSRQVMRIKKNIN